MAVDAYTNFAALANDAVNAYIAKKMIDLSDRILITPQLFEQYPLLQRMGKTIRVVRVQRLSLPQTPLVEGVTPAAVALRLESVEKTLDQWGLVVLLTDVADLVLTHPMFSIAIDRATMAMKETFEREDTSVMMAGTNVSYPGAVTTRGGLAATDVFNTAMVISIRAQLSSRGAPRFTNDGLYRGLIQPPHTAALLASDTTFQNSSNFARINKLEYGYLGAWMGVDWIEGNFLPILVGVPAPDTAAATITKAQYTVGALGTLATGNYRLKVIARELLTDYERRLSVQSGAINIPTGSGSITVVMPTSVNYTYDVYLSQLSGTVTYKVASRRAAGSTYVITTAPVGTEVVGQASPADGVTVYPGWVVGKGALGTSTLDGMALRTYLTPNGASDSDPIAQRRKIGAKVMRGSFILDNDFFHRLETSSALPAPLPA